MKLENIFKVLSSKTKKDIILHIYLCECSDCNVEKLCLSCNSKQSNISKHLMDLKKHKIVEYTKEGKYIRYKLTNQFIKEYKQIIMFILEKEKAFSCNC